MTFIMYLNFLRYSSDLSYPTILAHDTNCIRIYG